MERHEASILHANIAYLQHWRFDRRVNHAAPLT